MAGGGDLFLVIVGGIIGIAGTVVGPLALHSAQRKTEKKKHRTAKFEELITSLFEYDHWLNVRMMIRVFGNPDDNLPSPYAKVRATATAYFPQFNTDIGELFVSAMQFEVWTMTAQQRRVMADKGFAEGQREGYMPYRQKFEALLHKLEIHARDHLQ